MPRVRRHSLGDGSREETEAAREAETSGANDRQPASHRRRRAAARELIEEHGWDHLIEREKP